MNLEFVLDFFLMVLYHNYANKTSVSNYLLIILANMEVNTVRRQKEIPLYERYNTIFPTRLRAIMDELHVTQQDVADAIGKSRQAVGFYANGTSSPDWETITHLARYFNVSADWLLGLSEFTNPKTANLSVEDVGLSEQATTTLAEYAKSGNSIDEKKKQAINLLLKDDSLKEWGNQLLLNLSRYLFSEPIPKETLRFTAEGVKTATDFDLMDSGTDTTDFEYADILLDQLFVSRIIKSIEGIRYQYRNPQSMREMSGAPVLDEEKRRLLKELKESKTTST